MRLFRQTVRVKICGITRVEDALFAQSCGADAIGLVFAESPRRVTLERAREIARALGPWTALVGVFVNEPVKNLLKSADACGLSAVQLHGHESPAYAKSLRGIRVIKAFRMDETLNQNRVSDFPAAGLLFDTAVPGKAGGTGKTFDWERLEGKKFQKPVIISGGLCAENVAEVIRRLRPYGVDVSSGVETKPGEKNPRLIKEFIERAKSVA